MIEVLSLPFNITCGYCDCSDFGNLKVTPYRDVNRFEIEYYLVDALSTTTDDIEYPIKADYILIAKPGQRRCSKLPFYTMWIKFAADGILAEKLNATPMYFAAIHSDRIKELLSKLIILYDNENDELSFYSILLELLQIILEDSFSPEGSVSFNASIADKAKQYIDENYQKPITLNDIASMVSLSPNHFHTIFKSTCGISPHKYLILRRISAAKEMLWTTERKIPEIAEKCGFGCQQYFTKVFKQETGSTPGIYRKNLQKRYFLYD